MRILTALIILLMPLPARADISTGAGLIIAKKAFVPNYVFAETFEGALAAGSGDSLGYDNANWTENDETNPNYATSPAPLSGSYSLLKGSGITRNDGGANSCNHHYFMINSGVYSNWATIFSISNSAYNRVYNVRISGASGALYLEMDGGNITGTTDVRGLGGQTLHVWVDYYPGSHATLSYSTNGLKVEEATGATTESDTPYFINLFGNSGVSVIFDNIIAHTDAIGSNPL